MEGGIKIIKTGDTSSGRQVGKSRKQPVHKKPKFGILKGGKTQRSKARFESVRDPAKAPPSKRPSRLRILTEKGASTRRAALVADAKGRSIESIRKTLRENKMNVDKAPPELVRAIYRDAKGAGLISYD